MMFRRQLYYVVGDENEEVFCCYSMHVIHAAGMYLCQYKYREFSY